MRWGELSLAGGVLVGAAWLEVGAAGFGVSDSTGGRGGLRPEILSCEELRCKEPRCEELT